MMFSTGETVNTYSSALAEAPVNKTAAEKAHDLKRDFNSIRIVSSLRAVLSFASIFLKIQEVFSKKRIKYTEKVAGKKFYRTFPPQTFKIVTKLTTAVSVLKTHVGRWMP